MIPLNGGRPTLLGVQAGRGIAAALVVFVHCTALVERHAGDAPFGGLFRFGHAGVDFFFVLSGFIIYYIHRNDLGQPSQLGRYAHKRLVRIYPFYWVALALWGLVLFFSPPVDRAEVSAGNIISSILLLPRNQRPVLSVAWTLRHELMFYGLFGLLILNRTVGRSLLGLWAALTLWNAVVKTVTGTAYFSGVYDYVFFRPFNLEFFFGMGIAILADVRRIPVPRLLLGAGLVLFFGNGVFESFGPPLPLEWPPQHLVYAIGAALALAGVIEAERQGLTKPPRWMIRLGSASYAIYLVHDPVAKVTEHVLLTSGLESRLLHANLSFLLTAAIALCVGVILSERIEQPLLRAMQPGPRIGRHRVRVPVAGLATRNTEAGP